MNSKLITSSEIFKANFKLLNQIFSRLNEDNANQRISENTNPIIHIVGHITNYRFVLLNRLGENSSFIWEETFKRGARRSDKYPSPHQIKEEFDGVSEKLMKKLEILDDAALEVELPARNPFNDNSVLGIISFMSFHESYHLGQCSLIYKEIFNEGLVG